VPISRAENRIIISLERERHFLNRLGIPKSVRLRELYRYGVRFRVASSDAAAGASLPSKLRFSKAERAAGLVTGRGQAATLGRATLTPKKIAISKSLSTISCSNSLFFAKIPCSVGSGV
jgi:hypothetical protein